MTVDFKSLLNKPADEIERPKPLPPGTYHGVVTKFEGGETNNEKKTPFVRYFFAITGAGDDVDSAQLVGVDLSKKQMRRDFYLTDDAMYRLKEFIASCGVPTAGRTLGELVSEVVNAPVLISVTLRPNRDNTEMFNDVANVKGA